MFTVYLIGRSVQFSFLWCSTLLHEVALLAAIKAFKSILVHDCVDVKLSIGTADKYASLVHFALELDAQFIRMFDTRSAKTVCVLIL